MHRFIALLGLALLIAAPVSAQVNIGFGGVAYDSRQPVEVTADSLSVDQSTGEAVFSGNVIVVQGDMRMAAGSVRIVYATDGTQDVREVIATGGVLVTRGSDAAEGGSARFDVASALLTLTGDVLVTQGPTAIAGDRMVVNMTTGNGSVDGRVRTVLGGGE
ncbi:LptA/OstA family protein [Hasllibacter sp. MH4015]|uniref:LptA/OstA family protein n=1 Tax=Hasllibacter sp. MH4015 TaxID=2854029 RepID=UPI001CD6679D|nr:LptA/OstA family protein [Hasllibacter sp. MH4015]